MNPKPFSETSLTVRDLLSGIALADHMGDVNNYLPWLADALGEKRPTFDDERMRFVFPWETFEEAE